MFPRLTIDPPPRPKLACLFGFNRGRLTAGEVTCSTCDFISESVRRIRTPAFQAPSTNCADDLEPEPTVIRHDQHAPDVPDARLLGRMLSRRAALPPACPAVVRARHALAATQGRSDGSGGPLGEC